MQLGACRLHCQCARARVAVCVAFPNNPLQVEIRSLSCVWEARCAEDIIKCAAAYSEASLAALGQLTPGAENIPDAAAMALHKQDVLRSAERNLDSAVSLPAFFWCRVYVSDCTTRVSSGA